jgi:hypothetical protein
MDVGNVHVDIVDIIVVHVNIVDIVVVHRCIVVSMDVDHTFYAYTH